jgi:predicted acyl esterase
MAEEHEFFDAYWKGKQADFSKIKVPTYMLASYSSMLHTVGSIRAFREINTDKKWLRIHPHQEWYEDYLHSSVQDLDRFFERYLKGVENGWEATPRVRVSMLRFGENVTSQADIGLMVVSGLRSSRNRLSDSSNKVCETVSVGETLSQRGSR